LGLAILLQKAGRHDTACGILKEAVRHFPDHEPLNISLGISLMNLGQFDSALTRLLPFQNDHQVLRFILECYQALGDRESADRCRDRLQEPSSGN
jgi:tetratricopeptide (TPR) repeat protein